MSHDVLLLLKQKASNTDQLLKKQQYLEHAATEQEQHIKRLHAEIAEKGDIIKNLRDQINRESSTKDEINRLLVDNKSKDESIREKVERIRCKDDIIRQKDNTNMYQ